MLLFVIMSVMLITSLSLCHNIPKLIKLNEAYNQELVVYKNNTKEQERLLAINEDDKKELAKDKARKSGYSLPDDIVFYDVG